MVCMPTRYYDEQIKDMSWVRSTHVVEEKCIQGFWWRKELETWLGRLMGRIWNILCLFAMLKK